MWDVMFTTDAGATVGDNQLLGAEYAGGYFFATGGNSAADPNKLYKLDSSGNLVATVDQWSSAGWGWRDLAYDGTYLYGSDDGVVDAFDLDGVAVPAMNINTTISINRALAYDPILDHFWSKSFGDPLYEFDRAGNIIWSGSPAVTACYGAAWDDGAPDGPWLWLFDQTGSPQTTIFQFDPINKVLTGTSYVLPLVGGATAQLAGGLFFTNEYNAAFYTLGGMTQGTPDDIIFVLEMYPAGPLPDVAVNLTPVGMPIQIPAAGGTFDFNIQVINNETSAVNADVWTNVTLPTGGTYGPIINANFDLPASFMGDRDRDQAVPATAPPGTYTYNAYVGVYPGTVYGEDHFDFEKLTTGDGVAVTGWTNDGESFDEWFTSVPEELPTTFEVFGAYPNPFNPTTTISYALPEAGKVSLTVFDVSGREVAKLVDGYRNVGVHNVEFDATGLASGVYLYRLSANGNVAVNKMILMK